MMNFQDDDGLCVLELFFYSSFFYSDKKKGQDIWGMLN